MFSDTGSGLTSKRIFIYDYLMNLFSILIQTVL